MNVGLRIQQDAFTTSQGRQLDTRPRSRNLALGAAMYVRGTEPQGVRTSTPGERRRCV